MAHPMDRKCSTWEVTRHLPPQKQSEVGKRLKRIRGQVEGLLRMLAEDRTCAELLNQVLATQAALRSVQRVLLRHCLETCVRAAVLEGRNEIYDEIIEILERYG